MRDAFDLEGNVAQKVSALVRILERVTRRDEKAKHKREAVAKKRDAEELATFDGGEAHRITMQGLRDRVDDSECS